MGRTLSGLSPPLAIREEAPAGSGRPRLKIATDPGARGGTDVLFDPETTAFLEELAIRFETRRWFLLQERAALREGAERPTTEASTPTRPSRWEVAPAPRDLLDRRVEITAPADPKMIVRALRSGASVFMADFEDACAPSWPVLLRGQRALREAVRGTLPEPPGSAATEDRLATLMVRPRGWHLEEAHVRIDGEAMSASLFDFGVYLVHNAKALIERGSGPYFYLPKMEHATEAALWAEVFRFSEEALGLPRHSIRATALIETVPAMFEIESLLWELREYSAGLNGGRWDYIFSFIKQFRNAPWAVFPDRDQLVMTAPFLEAYSKEIVRVCHAHRAPAIGGMAAYIPVRDDPEANRVAFEAVAADKQREVRLGYDGTWVAHPGLVPVAKRIFDEGMPGANQIDRPNDFLPARREELLEVPRGTISHHGVRQNARVAVRYLDAWLRGQGCVPIDHKMEDAATVEIARSQLWQWVHHRAPLVEGGQVDPELVTVLLREEAEALRREQPERRETPETRPAAERILTSLVLDPELAEFLTIRAYGELDPTAG
jgi:malate synthase